MTTCTLYDDDEIVSFINEYMTALEERRLLFLGLPSLEWIDDDDCDIDIEFEILSE